MRYALIAFNKTEFATVSTHNFENSLKCKGNLVHEISYKTQKHTLKVFIRPLYYVNFELYYLAEQVCIM